MTEQGNKDSKYVRIAIFAVILVLIIYFIITNLGAFGNVLLVMLGFGAVVLVHEFGHFIVAKLSDIEVEAFSIFMPPILLGLKKTENGFRFRILPEIFPKETKEGEKEEESEEGAINFTIGKKGRPGETEYRIGLIPFGGFVKMLGQEDIGAVKSSDNPRSYANKPVHIRAATIAAGVCFNIVSAVIIFMIVFLIGIDLQPPKVGGVIPDSPAARAGIKAGDEFIKINGQTEDLDFSNIGIAAALSGENEEVPLTVRHTDGTEEEITLVAEELPGQPLRLFGVDPAASLVIAELSDDNANELKSRTGLQPGDRITSINGRDVRGTWELEEIMQKALLPEVILSAERKVSRDETEIIEATIPLNISAARSNNIETDTDLAHIYSMIPRMRISESFVVPDVLESGGQSPGFFGKLLSIFNTILLKISSVFVSGNEATDEAESPLKAGDIILAVGDVDNPTYKELRETVAGHKDIELPVKVLRTDPNGIERELTITIIPKQPEGSDNVLMGILLPVLDFEHPVVAKAIDIPQDSLSLEIPRGARITAVDGEPVENFFDIISQIRKYPGESISIEWRLDDLTAGSVAINVGTDEKLLAVDSYFAESIPFGALKETYRATGPINAVVMGYRRTVAFIAQTYVTLRRLIGGLVSPENLMGPLGIIKFSYDIVSKEPTVYYIYFLGLISAVIAVFNFLPLPPLDGGLVVLLIIEKIKGSALSERVQTIIAYTGWTMILALFLYVTFNDIFRSFFDSGQGL